MNSMFDFLRSKENRFLPQVDFHNVFEQNVQKFPTYRQAYEATERDYEEVNGERKYSSWYSFEEVRTRKRRKSKYKTQ